MHALVGTAATAERRRRGGRRRREKGGKDGGRGGGSGTQFLSSGKNLFSFYFSDGQEKIEGEGGVGEEREEGREELVLKRSRVLVISLAHPTRTYLRTHTYPPSLFS